MSPSIANNLYVTAAGKKSHPRGVWLTAFVL
jgi:hypothetical protein